MIRDETGQWYYVDKILPCVVRKVIPSGWKADNILYDMTHNRGKYWFIKNRNDSSEIKKALDELVNDLENSIRFVKKLSVLMNTYGEKNPSLEEEQT